MRRTERSPELAALLHEADEAGVEVEFELFDLADEPGEPDALHRAAVLATFPDTRTRPGDPKRVTMAAFLGAFYDAETASFPLLGAGGHSITGDDGYGYAFAHPPYSVQLSRERLTFLFHEVSRLAFGGVDAALDIRQWPTDWSPWFAAGHEWWGAYCWSVLNREMERVVVIRASSTD
jgi:hypothetical protein